MNIRETCWHMWVSQSRGTPKSSILMMRIFYYKPSIWGVPPWKPKHDETSWNQIIMWSLKPLKKECLCQALGHGWNIAQVRTFCTNWEVEPAIATTSFMTRQNGNIGIIKLHWWLVTGQLWVSSTESLKIFLQKLQQVQNRTLDLEEWCQGRRDQIYEITLLQRSAWLQNPAGVGNWQRSASPIHLWSNQIFWWNPQGPNPSRCVSKTKDLGWPLLAGWFSLPAGGSVYDEILGSIRCC